MVAAVLDASAVLALLRDEPGGDQVAQFVGNAAISAVNLQEVVKELMLSGLGPDVIQEIVGELRLSIRAHDAEAAYAAAQLHEQTRQYGRGLGDRSCLALAIALGVPAVTTDQEWKKVKAKGLKLQVLR